ncbi:MAG: ankyrin repeat domain-containing protein, partial [Candidatus Caldatribacteriota bacterium]
DEQCKAHDWVFDFLPDENAKYRIPKKNIYSCEKLIAWKNDFITGLDYAIIKLSKRVSGRKPLDIRRKGKIEDNADVMVIGNPYGLATKVAAGAKVVDNEDEAFFVTDLDTLQGNSGSAVFNAKTGVVEGILVRGEDDFEYDYDRECFKSKRCADANECRGEDVIRITELPEINSGGKLHMIAQKGNAEEIHPLLERTSWIDVIDEAGASPLMVAAKNDNLEVMDMLITLGADVNHQDINGNTALHVLANLGKESSEAFQKLLDNGAKMNIKNVSGQTAKAILKSVNSSNNHR